jgi:hypothetical protein
VPVRLRGGSVMAGEIRRLSFAIIERQMVASGWLIAGKAVLCVSRGTGMRSGLEGYISFVNFCICHLSLKGEFLILGWRSVEHYSITNEVEVK